MRSKIPESTTPVLSFVKTFENSIRSVLTQALGSEWSAVTEDEYQQTDAAEMVSFRCEVSNGLTGMLGVSLRSSDANRLAAGFVGEDAETFGPWQDEHREAFSELVRQILGELASQLAKDFGDVRIELNERSEVTKAGPQFCISVRSGERIPMPIYLHLASELNDSIVARSSPVALSTPGRSSHQENLELLMGVQLNATLRFGQRQMSLRELLNLNAGCIIELDRQVQEPVDLLVDGKVVAKGEVVILDGYYGMRITSVASPQLRAGFVM